MNNSISRRNFAVGSLAAGVLWLAACQVQRSVSDSTAMQSAALAGGIGKDFSRQGLALTTMAPRARMDEVVTTSTAEQQLPPVVAPSAMVIRNGSVTIEVDTLEVAIERVRQLAQSLGGYLGNVSTNTGTRQFRSATLEMKIPAARFDTAMVGMPTLGKVEQSNSTAQDVGEEFVDVGARVANAKRLEGRLVSILATRTGKLTDVLAVERELARVRQEIERYEGRMRYLSTRVATSTIVATVHEKTPIIAAQPGTNVFATAFLNMWRNFVNFLATSIELSGVLVPVALLGWLAYLGWKRWRRSGVSVPLADSAL